MRTIESLVIPACLDILEQRQLSECMLNIAVFCRTQEQRDAFYFTMEFLGHSLTATPRSALAEGITVMLFDGMEGRPEWIGKERRKAEEESLAKDELKVHLFLPPGPNFRPNAKESRVETLCGFMLHELSCSHGHGKFAVFCPNQETVDIFHATMRRLDRPLDTTPVSELGGTVSVFLFDGLNGHPVWEGAEMDDAQNQAASKGVQMIIL